MSHESDPPTLLEERAVDRALGALAMASAPAPETLEDPEVAPYLEALAALPLALETTPAPVSLRREILRRATAARATAEAGTGATVTRLDDRRKSRSVPRGTVWSIPLAAVLALCVVGLGLVALRLEDRLTKQETVIAQLRSQLEAPSSSAAEAAELRRELDDLNQRFMMITRTAARLYPLHPTPQMASSTSGLRGVMYVCSQHQRWYLNLQGLEPAQAGNEYHLWFITDQGLVDARAFQVVAGEPTELGAQTMPAGTHGVAVSLEPEGAARTEAPRGPIVLRGDQSMRI